MSRITKNDFEVWLADPVTQELIQWVKEGYGDAANQMIVGNDETILRVVHARNEAMSIYTDILEWKPQELINQEE